MPDNLLDPQRVIQRLYEDATSRADASEKKWDELETAIADREAKLRNCMENHEILQQQYIRSADKWDALRTQLARRVDVLSQNIDSPHVPQESRDVLIERRASLQIVLGFMDQLDAGSVKEA